MEFLSKESLQRIAEKSELAEQSKGAIGLAERAIFEDIGRLSDDGDVSMEEESVEEERRDERRDERKEESEKQQILGQVRNI